MLLTGIPHLMSVAGSFASVCPSAEDREFFAAIVEGGPGIH